MAVLEIESELFAQRLADLLSAKRRGNGGSRTAMARQSDGRFSAGELRRFEAGRTTLSPEMVEELTSLYDVDLAAILPARAPLAIAPGAVSVGGRSTSFVGTDATSLLRAYLQLIRSLRNQRKVAIIVLRREDIESLAAYLDENGEDVLDRLAALMGATRSQRTSLTALFSTGAAVIGIVGASAIAHRAVANDHIGGSVRANVVVAVNAPATSVSSGFSTISATPVLAISAGVSNAAVDPVVAPVAVASASMRSTTGSGSTIGELAALVAAAPLAAAPVAAPPVAAPPTTAAKSTTHRSSATRHTRSTTTIITTTTTSDSGSADNGAADGSAISSGTTPGGDQASESPTTTATDAVVASDAPAEAPVVAVGMPPVPTSTTPIYAVGEPPVPSIPDSTADQTTTTLGG